MAELTTLKNIGPEMARKLEAVDIHTADELAQAGSKEAWMRMKIRFPEVCLVHLYTLQAALDGVEMSLLPDETKRDLKAFSDAQK